jgi:hypothetical protein
MLTPRLSGWGDEHGKVGLKENDDDVGWTKGASMPVMECYNVSGD